MFFNNNHQGDDLQGKSSGHIRAVLMPKRKDTRKDAKEAQRTQSFKSGFKKIKVRPLRPFRLLCEAWDYMDL